MLSVVAERRVRGALERTYVILARLTVLGPGGPRSILATVLLLGENADTQPAIPHQTEGADA